MDTWTCACASHEGVIKIDLYFAMLLLSLYELVVCLPSSDHRDHQTKTAATAL